MLKKTVVILSLIISVLLFIVSCGESKLPDSNAPAVSQDLNNATDKNTAAETITEIPQPIIEKRTSFIGCGDNIIYGTKEAVIHAQGTERKYNYKPYYDGVSNIIKEADIAFINQETLMCGDGYSLSYYPRFNSPRELGYDLHELGFDVVNIANNHMLDKGADGLSKTIEFWKSFNDILMIGGYEDIEDYDNIRILEKDGVKIAFLSYTQMTNGLSKPASSPLAIPYTNDEDIVRQAALAKQTADLVMVSVHWGNEGSFIPTQEQKRLAQLFSDCGVDVILGHHPHVVQPVEWLNGKDGNKTLCVYSLGNFMAQQDRDYNMVGGIISFDIVHSEQTPPYIDNVIFNPTVFHFNSRFTQNNVYLMENYTRELADSHGVRGYYGNSLSYDKLISYAVNTIDKEFLPEYFHEIEE